ncbi:MAG: hypothetical protein WCH05_06645 [Chlorobiaceae bacterium]
MSCIIKTTLSEEEVVEYERRRRKSLVSAGPGGLTAGELRRLAAAIKLRKKEREREQRNRERERMGKMPMKTRRSDLKSETERAAYFREELKRASCISDNALRKRPVPVLVKTCGRWKVRKTIGDKALYYGLAPDMEEAERMIDRMMAMIKEELDRRKG